jgi:hypothetical protein
MPEAVPITTTSRRMALHLGAAATPNRPSKLEA